MKYIHGCIYVSMLKTLYTNTQVIRAPITEIREYFRIFDSAGLKATSYKALSESLLYLQTEMYKYRSQYTPCERYDLLDLQIMPDGQPALQTCRLVCLVAAERYN
jgi:hypothetical protein